MKGVVLAGGLGTRLRPLTKAVNKHLVLVYNKPLIYYPIVTLREVGIHNIIIITGVEYIDQVRTLLGSGEDLGVDLDYNIQTKPGGIAQGLSIAEHFAYNHRVALILGDNIFEDNLKDAVRSFRKQEEGAKIFIKQVPDPERFGVVEFNKQGDKIIQIIEKPTNPPSNWMVTGFYLYDKTVFDKIRTLSLSARKELEITDLNNIYLKEGALTFSNINGRWIDAGTFDSLLEANNFIAQKEKE